MNADELYKISRKAFDKPKSGLSVSVHNKLVGAGFKSNTDLGLDVDAIYKAVISGKIWTVRRLGAAGIKEICVWLSAQPTLAGGRATPSAKPKSRRNTPAAKA